MTGGFIPLHSFPWGWISGFQQVLTSSALQGAVSVKVSGPSPPTPTPHLPSLPYFVLVQVWPGASSLPSNPVLDGPLASMPDCTLI